MASVLLAEKLHERLGAREDAGALEQPLAVVLGHRQVLCHHVDEHVVIERPVRQLDAEWDVSIETALEMEARAQAHCMQTKDFKRAYDAFAAKQKPEFKGD